VKRPGFNSHFLAALRLRFRSLAAALLVACSAPGGHASAQKFPDGPVKIVVPYPISGPTDIRGSSRVTKTYKLIAMHAPPPISDTLARIVARAIGAESRHPVVLERLPGAVTTRGATAVAKSPADGHTLLLASNATMVIDPYYFQGVKYDPVRDFVLIAPVATMPFVLLVNSVVPADTLPGLVAWLKVRPGEVNFSSSGEGSIGHLAGELFRRKTGVNAVHVSYNGGMAALNGLATGQVSLMFAALPLALPYLSSPHLRPLGLASRQRFEPLPGLATLAESGLPGFEVEAWFGVYGPARVPPSVMVWLSEQIAAYVAQDSIRSPLLELGLDPATGTLAQFAARIHSETERWAPIIRESRTPSREGA